MSSCNVVSGDVSIQLWECLHVKENYGRKTLKETEKCTVDSDGSDVFEPQLFSSPQWWVLITNNQPDDKSWQWLAANWLQFTPLIVWLQACICLRRDGGLQADLV